MNKVKLSDLKKDSRRPGQPLFVSTTCGFDLDFFGVCSSLDVPHWCWMEDTGIHHLAGIPLSDSSTSLVHAACRGSQTLHDAKAAHTVVMDGHSKVVMVRGSGVLGMASAEASLSSKDPVRGPFCSCFGDSRFWFVFSLDCFGFGLP